MRHRTPASSAAVGRGALVWRFALPGALIGFLIGLLEAGLFYWVPRASGLILPDTSYVIWFIAPALDLLAGFAIGAILGVIAGVFTRGTRLGFAGVAAIGLGLVAAYVVRLLTWLGIGAGWIFPTRLESRTPAEWFLLVLALGFFVLVRRDRATKPGDVAVPHRAALLWFIAIVIAMSVAGISYYAAHRPFTGKSNTESASHRSVSNRTNVALIVLDTVRADHLSCYGYARPTTPNIDRLAARGTLFENAVTPSSWTLPSIVAILTGLMPHQSGADWGQTFGAAPWTLARILASKGYETAGFNANPFYGLAGWRLSEGFHLYDDDASSIRHNLAVTFVGQSVLRWLYDHCVRYNQFDHRDAEDLNHDVERWAERRDPSKPYFLFVNYMDAHRPYLPPARFDHRFGRIPASLLASLTQPLNDGRPRRPYSSQDRADLIDGYDNSLAYLDRYAGRLIDLLRRSPGGDHTIIVVTSDHGEGFGEHGTYDHGWNLYNGVIRVPLIITGPGIPQGLRVPALVSNRDIFATILDLTLGLKGPVAATSLRSDWASRTASGAALQSRGVVSELNVFAQGADPAALSLTTPEWHLILSSQGGAKLYRWPADPQETRNLANDPQRSTTVAQLESLLESRLAYSLLPWRDLAYLSPLNGGGETFVEQISRNHAKLPSTAGVPMGSAQAIFSGHAASQLIHPSPEQRALRTLPYH